MISIKKLFFVSSLCILNMISAEASVHLTVSTNDVTVLVNHSETFHVLLSGHIDQNFSISFVKQHPNLVDIVPSTINFNKFEEDSRSAVNVIGIQPGHLLLTAQSENNITTDNVFVRIIVANSDSIIYVSIIFGWLYFVAWSISFYPQIYTNFKLKNVSGLNIDFVVLNIFGFLLYSIFNVGLYWIPEIQNEYANRYPKGLNPVQINDVVFSLHAAFASIITISQCFMYAKKNDQRFSKTAGGLLTFFIAIVIITAGLSSFGVIHWLDFLYFCSYIKLTITIIKYLPQAVMNYRRKSTIGWSIGNILLDFLGAILSMAQMLLNAYNYDDWVSIFGDPTKFGLGLFSILFDVFFMFQHYVLYRHAKEISISQVTTVEGLSTAEAAIPYANKKPPRQ